IGHGLWRAPALGHMRARDVRRWAERRIGPHLVADFACDRLNVTRLEDVLLTQEAGEHQAIAKRVDTARNTAAPRVDQVKTVGFEARVILPSNVVQAMLDIGLRLRPVERT